jgi:hypothetical protein
VQDINWDYYPEPYNRQLPYAFGMALKRFRSEEGLELLNFMLELARTQTNEQPTPKADEARITELMEAVSDLPDPWEFQAVVALSRHHKEAIEARIEQMRGGTDLIRDMMRLHERAWELEPALPKDCTFGEAVKVLKKHGVPLGISEEVLEMVLDTRTGEIVDEPEGFAEYDAERRRLEKEEE